MRAVLRHPHFWRCDDKRRQRWAGAWSCPALTFARSVDPLIPLEIAITRIAVTKPEDAVRVATEGDGKTQGKETEMGRKALVPYGLYRSHGFVTPSFARSMGFDDGDLDLFWHALQGMWDLDRSSSRGPMSLRGL